MTDRISVKNLCLHGFHGVYPEERKLGQKFFVDIDCRLDLAACAGEDDYSKAVCYGALCDLAAEISGLGPYNLIETLGVRIAEAVLARFDPVGEVRVRVRKPSAPIAAALDHVEIEIVRTRRRRVAFSLGSNIGDKPGNLRTALAWMNTLEGTVIDRVSRFYKTEPWGETDQDWFLNACAMGWTTAAPVVFLQALKRIELTLGRVPGRRWGPRTIDIDILFIDDLEMETPLLTLPHRDMFNRAFVLIPLAEIAAEQVVQGRKIGDAATGIDVAEGDIVPLEE
jgi:dihydroneopterin aldolase / 2-amino-4-hydroxy-6-hydroxymethyldihydropteridine diphosphokinase